MSEESVKKQIEGFCEEISEKNDWTTFNINVGRQYPVRLSTKLEALVKAGREAKNNKAVWTFSESQGGENPNKPGEPCWCAVLCGTSIVQASGSGSSRGQALARTTAEPSG